MFLQILIVSCLAVFANAQISTSNNDCPTYGSAQSSCNSQNMITGGADFTWATVEMFYELNGTVYCTDTNKGNFMKRAKCVQAAYIACGKNNSGMLVPSADGIGKGVEYFCMHHTDFDMMCVSEVRKCAMDKAGTKPAMTVEYDMAKKYYCGLADHVGECIESNDKLKMCAKSQTQKIMMDIAKEIIPPACHGGSQKFLISSVLLLVSLFITL